MSRSINKPEILAALIWLVLGVGVIVIGSSYPMGEIERMGPGYFPVLLGIVLSLIGVGLIFEAMRNNSAKLHFPLRPFVTITAGVLAFGFLVERAGLIPAIFSLIILSVLGERPARFRSAIAISIAMSLFGVLVFIKGLGIPLSAFWW